MHHLLRALSGSSLAGLLLMACGDLQPPASAPAAPPRRAQRSAELPARATAVLVRPADDAPPHLVAVEPLEEEWAAPALATPAPAAPAAPGPQVSTSAALPLGAGSRPRAGGQARGEPGGLNRIPTSRDRGLPESGVKKKDRAVPPPPPPQTAPDSTRRRDRKP